MNRSRNLVILVALILAVFAMPASAQVYTGRIDVTAVDSTGAVLPGVTVEIGARRPECRSRTRVVKRTS